MWGGLLQLTACNIVSQLCLISSFLWMRDMFSRFTSFWSLTGALKLHKNTMHLWNECTSYPQTNCRNISILTASCISRASESCFISFMLTFTLILDDVKETSLAWLSILCCTDSWLFWQPPVPSVRQGHRCMHGNKTRLLQPSICYLRLQSNPSIQPVLSIL